MLDEAASAGSAEARAMVTGDVEYLWLNLLLSAVKRHVESSGNERLVAKALFLWGRKHGESGLVFQSGRFLDFLIMEPSSVLSALSMSKFTLFVGLQKICRKNFVLRTNIISFNIDITTRVCLRLLSVMQLRCHTSEDPSRESSTKQQQSSGHCRWLYAGDRDLRKGRSSDKRYCMRLY